PVLLTPTDGAFINDDTPEFTWTSTAEGGDYTLEYSQDASFSTGVTTISGITGESYAPTTALAQGEWYWHVEAFDPAGNNSGYQTAFSFTIDTDPPDVPTLLTPADGIYVTIGTPTFTWSSTAGTGGDYTLEYSQDGSFTTGVTTITGLTSESYTPSSDLAEGTWYWHVEAFDQAGNNSGYQTAFSFDLDSEPPDPPELLSPADGSTTTDDTPTFTWSATAGTGGTYTLQYSKYSDFSAGVATYSNIFSTSFTPTTGLDQAVWYWRAQAFDPAGNPSGYQTPFSVTIDTDSPYKPALLTPEDESYITDDTPEFTWTETAGAGGTYTLEYSQDASFTTAVTTIGDLTAGNYTPPSPMAQTTWYWHVQAFDEVGNGSGYQLYPHSFTIDTDAPEMPGNFSVQPGHEKCKLSWSNPGGDPSFAGVEIRRNLWAVGAYPEYDDLFPTPMEYPATPTEGELVYKGPLEAFRDSADVADFPRNIYYYTIFSYDAAGNYSGATAAQMGCATNYWLGDVTGNGGVYYDDLTLLSVTYWLTDGMEGYNAEFDIGPTQTGSCLGLPTTDNVINFEDLIILATNYAVVGPNTKLMPQLPQHEVNGPLSLNLDLVSEEEIKAGDEFEVSVDLENNADLVKGLNLSIQFDQDKLKFLGIQSAENLGVDKGLTFFASRRNGNKSEINLAALGSGTCIKGSGQIAVLEFRLLESGNLDLEFSEAEVRDAKNQPLAAVKNGLQVITAAQIPGYYSLGQNRPNPFNMETEIAYELPENGFVDLTIYNILGQKIRSLVSQYQDAGTYRVGWDGRSDWGSEVASGVYFYLLKTGRFSETKKMILLK
ncbi:MAG: Ig-like domain-containing protein, partial [Calditrichia bacterium]